MTNRSSKPAPLLAVLAAGAMLSSSAFAQTNYYDMVDDILATDPILDISSVEVANTISDLIFKITINKASVDPNWGKYMIAIDSTPGGDTTGNGWGRPISMSQGMDYWIGSWVDSTPPGGQLWNWTGSSWAGPASAQVSTSDNMITISVPFASMGLSIGSTFSFDVVSSGGGNDSAIDSVMNPDQTVTNWGDQYDISINNLPMGYTLVQPPDPTNRVTFMVDMQVPIELFDADYLDPDGFDTNNDVVYVSGSFNGWGGPPSSDYALIQVGPTLFSNTVDVIAAKNSTVSYKFFGATFPGWEAPLLQCNNNRTLQITNEDMSAPLAYWSDRMLTDPDVEVTYSVDMSLQQALGNFTNGVHTVSLRGAFNSWGQLDMTPGAAPDTNIFTASVKFPYTPIGACENPYKFFFAPPDHWESPISTGGGNRNFTISSADQVLPTVYWNDETPCDVLESTTDVTFSIDMSGATGTDSIIYDGTQTVYLNGEFLGWWGWGAPGPTNYALTKSPTSDVHSITLPITAGEGLVLTYKYSMGGADNEAGFAVNHVRYIRTDAGSTNFALPQDLWINTNPSASHTETEIGGLTALSSTPGYVTLEWMGLPCTMMQGSANINGPYQDLFEARGIASTNLPSTDKQMFFRMAR